MTNTDISNELALKWAGKTGQEIAADILMIFHSVYVTIPIEEHAVISMDLETEGILVNHDINVLTTSKGICRRKRNPNN